MDHEVFLISRMARLRRQGADESGAIVGGLAQTGGIITGAAAIMAIVFGAFTATGFLLIKMLGFTLAATVLIDATLARTVLSPALMRLAGRWNWWTGIERRDRRRSRRSPCPAASPACHEHPGEKRC